MVLTAAGGVIGETVIPAARMIMNPAGRAWAGCCEARIRKALAFLAVSPKILPVKAAVIDGQAVVYAV